MDDSYTTTFSVRSTRFLFATMLLFKTEWTMPAFRNFVHQQQFATWQNRHASLYGVGTLPTAEQDVTLPDAEK
jgi:hypothetical protein